MHKDPNNNGHWTITRAGLTMQQTTKNNCHNDNDNAQYITIITTDNEQK